jgi:hypothetical protein
MEHLLKRLTSDRIIIKVAEVVVNNIIKGRKLTPMVVQAEDLRTNLRVREGEAEAVVVVVTTEAGTAIITRERR